MMTFLGSAVGDPEATAYAERAHEIAVATGDARLVRRARFALLDVTSRQRPRCRHVRCSSASTRSPASATICRRPRRCTSLAWVELWAGRWELAAEYAERAYDLMTQYGLEVPWAHLPIAVVAAHRGRLELAREHSERALQLGEEQFGRHTPVHLGTLGFVALQSGDPQTALRWFAEAEAVTTRLGWRDAGRRWWVVDHVEALLALDRVDDAVRRPRGVGGRATGGRRPGARARDALSRSRRRRPRGRRRRGRRSSGTRSRSTRAWRRSLRARSRTARARRSSAGASGRSAPPARRSPRRSTGSSSSGRRPGSRRRAPSSAGSAAATRDGGPDAGGAPRGGARRRGAHEQGGRRRALPRRADGRDAPLARLRQARRAVAGRARAGRSGRTSKVQGNSRFQAEPGGLASSECRATSSRRSSPAAPSASVRRASGGRARPPRR